MPKRLTDLFLVPKGAFTRQTFRTAMTGHGQEPGLNKITISWDIQNSCPSVRMHGIDADPAIHMTKTYSL